MTVAANWFGVAGEPSGMWDVGLPEGSTVDEVVSVGELLAVLWGVGRWSTLRRSGRLRVSQDTVARLRRAADEGGQWPDNDPSGT